MDNNRIHTDNRNNREKNSVSGKQSQEETRNISDIDQQEGNMNNGTTGGVQSVTSPDPELKEKNSSGF